MKSENFVLARKPVMNVTCTQKCQIPCFIWGYFMDLRRSVPLLEAKYVCPVKKAATHIFK
jgi:hypothetical protein